jgi:hypothetical protein
LVIFQIENNIFLPKVLKLYVENNFFFILTYLNFRLKFSLSYDGRQFIHKESKGFWGFTATWSYKSQ